MTPKNDLFIEHLEDVGYVVFEKYASVITQYIKGRNGIYALYRQDELYYVGLASDLRRRLKQHRDDRHAERWNRFSVYLTRNERFLKELETLLLRISLPEGNHVRGKFRGSTDLKPSLMSSIKQVQDSERNGLLGRSSTTKQANRTKSKRPNRAIILRREYKGRVYWARLRSDGTVRIADKVYDSVTGAAKSVVKRSINGWLFWNAKNEDGDWVKVGTFR